ncbi:MAG: sulfur oxidation c-type cytochrome SoxA, partial [Alphaproteobacteria bacterium]
MKFKAMTAVAALLVAAPMLGMADEEAELVVNGEIEMVTKTDAPAHLEGALPEIMSGWRFRSAETQQTQMDDFDNPGMIFVDQAQAVWDTAEGSEGKSCASCHNDVESMEGVRA